MKIAFDFDGTLADITHRLPLIKPADPKAKKDWPAFFRACVDDSPVMPVIRACNAMIWAGHCVEVWSGRSDVVRAESETWLRNHVIDYTVLRMRKEGDYRADHVVKAEWLEAMAPEDRPVLAFDDRQQVVDMWRAHGIICCQVAPGDF